MSPRDQGIRRVIHLVTNEFHPRTGGIASYCRGLAKGIQSLNHPVTVHCPGPLDDIHLEAVEVRPFGGRGSQDPDDLLRLFRVFSKRLSGGNEDTLILAEPGPIKAMLLFYPVLKRMPARILLVLHGSEIVRMHANPFWRILLSRFGKRISRFGVVSGHTRRLVEDRFPEWRDRIVVANPALDSGWQSSVPEKVNSDSCLRLLTVARLHPRKGQLDVIEAINRVKVPDGVSLSYTLVGQGNRPAYQKELETAGNRCRHDIRLLGELRGADLLKAYSESDIFIMASRNDPRSVESFGIAYLEAAAAGLPVIATDIGGVHEAVQADETALLVPPGYPVALEEAIQLLIDDPKRRHAMGENGRQFASSFKWESTARALLAT
jgi:phosphatidylinositol alpha-1,6-mannosyltransferase